MHRLFPPFVRGYGAIGLMLVRVLMGVAFVLHGWGKVQAPMNWMGPDAGVPGVLQAAAAISEFGGGILLVLGLLTPLASAAIAAVMIGALNYHIPAGDPFVAAGPGQASWELAAGYLATAIMFLLVGPGALSADACLFDKPPEL